MMENNKIRTAISHTLVNMMYNFHDVDSYSIRVVINRDLFDRKEDIKNIVSRLSAKIGNVIYSEVSYEDIKTSMKVILRAYDRDGKRLGEESSYIDLMEFSL